ncbi:uncharacterized protein BXZ73DRAFT_104589 [Epithele typhae]|uniref:uncharacterized protein n=1 Tax=Epithele typhae TaxID=378194 RepID=UPI00200851B0|nr:uncharacterized protein BXZ73DRAFT_104589 [Epithele typhae]KAH9920855.1 hypothetical protein BXZ73DRAFT_104589 [Epithele typhae]
MASAFIYYRIFTLVTVFVTAIVVLILSVQTAVAVHSLILEDSGVTWSNAGIAASIITLVGMSFIFLRECIGRGALVLYELVVLFLSSILFFVTGTAAFTDGSAVMQPVRDFGLACKDFDNSDLVTICRDQQPIGIISVAAGVWLAIYCLVLVFVAQAASSRGKSIWTSEFRVDNTEKKLAGPVQTRIV